MKQKIKVWDAPTRLFHWLLVLLMGFMWYSATQGGDMLVWHLRGGLLMLALVVFRLCWGIWGSDTAKFCRFVRPFSEIRRYTQGRMSEDELVGHNPLGALMVIALLAALVFQTATGLFAADENTFTNSGFLNHLVSEHAGTLARKIHVNFFNVLAVLAGVHIAAVLLYRFVKKQDLITPMINGFKTIDAKQPKLAGMGQLFAALLVAIALVCAVWMLRS